jgi:hypothetical protein
MNMANIEKPKSMTARALYEIREMLKRECNDIKKEECAAAHVAINDYERSVRADTIKRVVAAIKESAPGYRLVTTNACNIVQSSYNISGPVSLRFEIVFEPASVKTTSKHQQLLFKIGDARKKALEQLDQWYRDGLYDIANRREVKPFEVPK